MSTALETPLKDSSVGLIAIELFKKWNFALRSGDVNQIANLYWSSRRFQPAVSFHPTMSNKLVTDRAGVVAYFEDFLKESPDGNLTESKASIMGNGAILHTGKYIFAVGPDDNRTSLSARFTFIWLQYQSEWKIMHHHSSKLPQ